MTTPHSDPYEGLGEFHDLFMVEPWERLRPSVARLFGDLTHDGVVVDLGAGTGMGTRVLAAESQARVVAVEPSLTMRAVLTARVADSDAMRERVSVWAGSVPVVLGSLPASVDGVLCAHVLGHLTDGQRVQLVRWLSQALRPGRSALVTTQEPDDADVAGEVTESRQLGGLGYRVTYLPGGTEGFSSRYEVLEGDRVLRTETFRGRWETVTHDELDTLAAGHGLRSERVAPGVTALHRPS